jgi:hypothetical protein
LRWKAEHGIGPSAALAATECVVAAAIRKTAAAVMASRPKRSGAGFIMILRKNGLSSPLTLRLAIWRMPAEAAKALANPVAGS